MGENGNHLNLPPNYVVMDLKLVQRDWEHDSKRNTLAYKQRT